MDCAEKTDPKVPTTWFDDYDSETEELFVLPPEREPPLPELRKRLKPYANDKWLEGLPKVFPVYGISGTIVFNRPECNLKILKDTDLTIVKHVCPRLFTEFQYLGETFLLTVQSHPVAAFVGLLYFINWGTYKTNFSLKSLPSPTPFTLPIHIYHLGEIYELEDLRRQAKYALTHNVELSCSSAAAPTDLCESIRYLYSNLRESSDLREIIAHYVVDCFCRHRLENDEGFKQTVFECPLFHKDLLRANSVSEFAAQGAGNIIRLGVCQNKIHSDLSGGADFTCEFHENTAEALPLLPSSCSFAEVRPPANKTTHGFKPTLSDLRRALPFPVRQEEAESFEIERDTRDTTLAPSSSIWKSHAEERILEVQFVNDLLDRVPTALSRSTARSQPEDGLTVESPKKKQKHVHKKLGSQSDGYGSFEEIDASESETESEWSVVTPTNRSPVLRATQPDPSDPASSMDTDCESSVGHISALDTPLRPISPVQPLEPVSSSASSTSNPDVEYRLNDGQSDEDDLALATALNNYVNNDVEEFEVSVQRAIEASYRQMKQDMRMDNKEHPAQPPRWPFPLENSSQAGPRAVSYSDTEEEAFSPQQVNDLQTSLNILAEKMVHMKNRTGEWSMEKKQPSPAVKAEERSLPAQDPQRKTRTSIWKEQGRLIQALAQTRNSADAPESSRDAAQRAAVDKRPPADKRITPPTLVETSDEEAGSINQFRRTLYGNRLPLRPSVSKVSVWSQASTLNAEQLPLRTRDGQSENGPGGSLQDLSGLRILDGGIQLGVATAASSSTLAVNQEDGDWNEASVLFSQDNRLDLDRGADADVEQATDDDAWDTDSSWSDVESVINEMPGRRTF